MMPKKMAAAGNGTKTPKRKGDQNPPPKKTTTKVATAGRNTKTPKRTRKG